MSIFDIYHVELSFYDNLCSSVPANLKSSSDLALPCAVVTSRCAQQGRGRILSGVEHCIAVL
ncbi:MAG TPA: hypothetical protein VND65_18040 [Candidatus Binatia bacterium]|nr:hypothetical protein [Candidatus Binatia bacterium]